MGFGGCGMELLTKDEIHDLAMWSREITISHNTYGMTLSYGDVYQTYNGYTQDEAMAKFKQLLGDK